MGLIESTVRVRLSHKAGDRLWEMHRLGWGISMTPDGDDGWIVGFRDEECLRVFLERAMGVLGEIPRKEFHKMVAKADG